MCPKSQKIIPATLILLMIYRQRSIKLFNPSPAIIIISRSTFSHCLIILQKLIRSLKKICNKSQRQGRYPKPILF